MPLLGNGVLAIWNGIANDKDAEFLEWHMREHIPERVGLPGFRRGRRYVAVDGVPGYFNFYEVSDPAVLVSQTYLERLNEPSEWTEAIVMNFTDTSRTACRVAASIGQGVGCFVDVLRFDEFDDAAAECAAALVSKLVSLGGISAAHLLRREALEIHQPTAEMRLRGVPDHSSSAIMIVESSDRESLLSARNGATGDSDLRRAGLSEPSQRGLYRFQFGLDQNELALASLNKEADNRNRISA